MTTKLEGELKRELLIDRQAYTQQAVADRVRGFGERRIAQIGLNPLDGTLRP